MQQSQINKHLIQQTNFNPVQQDDFQTPKLRDFTQSPININYNNSNNQQNTVICIEMQDSKPLFTFDEFVLITKQKQKDKEKQSIKNSPIVISFETKKEKESSSSQKNNNKLENQKLDQEDIQLLKQCNYDSNRHQKLVQDLKNKLSNLQAEYKRLLSLKQKQKQKQKSRPRAISISFKKAQFFLSKRQQTKKRENCLKVDEVQNIEPLKYIDKIPNNSTLPLFRLKIEKVYEYRFESLKNGNQTILIIQDGISEKMSESQQNQQRPKQNTQRPNMVKSINLDQHLKQFSSGQVENLLMQDESFVSQNQEKHSQVDTKKQNPKDTEMKISRLDDLQSILIPTTLTARSKKQSPSKNPFSSYHLPFISLSRPNISIIKQSSETLPYQKILKIMTIQKFQTRLSFKSKHYPSSSSTQKQIKLYGKRIFRLLSEVVEQKRGGFIQGEEGSKKQQHISAENPLHIQNQMQSQINQHFVVYYLKGNKNFIAICYFNHTIYIGQYITQGPKQQISRQGYGIQYRENKYVYQGQFFADKKHGYGFLKNLGKNPFIYFGYFLDGFMDGNGKEMNQKGEVYLGEYKIGQRDGFGKLVYNQEKNVYYEGEFYDGHKHGKGTEHFLNGDSYTGSFVKDKFEGQGQYKWKNGIIYKGQFSQGYKHGKGILIHKNGKQFHKIYEYNKQINTQNNDDKKTIKTSRISSYSQSKTQQKTLIQEKTKKLRSYSKQSILSNLSKSKSKRSIKLSKQKNKLIQILKQKQMQQDLQNLDKILKDPTIDYAQVRKNRIFSISKLQTKDKLLGKMYSTAQRPAMKISQNQKEIDLYQLSKTGKKKSLITFTKNQQLQDFKQQKKMIIDKQRHKIHPSSNFQDF